VPAALLIVTVEDPATRFKTGAKIMQQNFCARQRNGKERATTGRHTTLQALLKARPQRNSDLPFVEHLSGGGCVEVRLYSDQLIGE
jgi:hypothetical protein